MIDYVCFDGCVGFVVIVGVSPGFSGWGGWLACGWFTGGGCGGVGDGCGDGGCGLSGWKPCGGCGGCGDGDHLIKKRRGLLQIQSWVLSLRSFSNLTADFVFGLGLGSGENLTGAGI